MLKPKVKTITGILFSTNKKPEVITIEKTLEAYYKILNCDVIDITTRSIGGVYYDIVCDDEGLLKTYPICTAITLDHLANPTCELVGNILVCKRSTNGITSLCERDIKRIFEHRFGRFLILDR